LQAFLKCNLLQKYTKLLVLNKKNIKYYAFFAIRAFFIAVFCVASSFLSAQQPADSVLVTTSDSIVSLNDSTSLSVSVSDSTVTVKKEKDAAFEAKLMRTAVDSVIQDLKENKIYYYGNAVVKYEDIVLEAAMLEFDMNTNTVKARGVIDSTGKLMGTPVFTQGETKFEAQEMSYNFKTKKGVITKVFTEEAGGYLNGKVVKRMDDNSVNIKSGGYSSCNLKEHPHYQFRFNKAKVIPDDKIVTGPIYMVIEDVPLPVGLPFALLPNTKSRRSGIVMPTYGESTNRGFYLENGGYYWAINDKMDLQILGDIYTRGSWAIKPTFRYVQRYKFTGSLSFVYAMNKIGTRDAADYQKSNDFQFKWSHKQDPKAHPRHMFSADVNIISSAFNKYNASTSNEYLSNTFKSSIAYQTNFAGKVFLTLNASHSQNTLTKQVTISLPEITLTVNRFYPLKKVGKPGKKHWYKDLNLSYTLNAKNTLTGIDSLLFPKGWYKDFGTLARKMQNGIKHTVPINLPIKLFKYLTWTNSITLTDYMYFSHQESRWAGEVSVNGNVFPAHLVTDTVFRFRNFFDFNVSSNLTTKIYGMVNFKKGPIRAIRHVFTPTIGFTYRPDFGDPKWHINNTYMKNGEEVLYNMYASAIYGYPSLSRSSQLTYNFANSLEMKVPSRRDTVTGLKKVTLIESLNFSGNYDFSKDSLNFSYLSISGRTTLFKHLGIQYSSLWDPYVCDENGNRVNRLEVVENKRLFHKSNSSWNFSLSFSFSQNDIDKLKKRINAHQSKRENLAQRAPGSEYVTDDILDEIAQNSSDYIDWTVPWSLSISYNLRHSTSMTYARIMGIATNTLVQTLSVSGDISITPKWKVSFTTGWDFTNHGLSYTSINVYRDLHCWEMRFNWIPIGTYKSWNFSINIKASALQDLKLTKKKDFRDN